MTEEAASTSLAVHDEPGVLTVVHRWLEDERSTRTGAMAGGAAPEAAL